MKALSVRDTNADFRYWGGDHMAAQGGEMDVHIRETSVMGFVEVMKQLPKFSRLMKETKRAILDYMPDKVILIDYPGFNLRMAKWLKSNGFHVTYYISPQLWAWKKGRITSIQNYVDDMLVILPFEHQFYASHNVNVHYVGHPLVPVIDDFKSKNKKETKAQKPQLALLPGSRKQEIKNILPRLLAAANQLKDKYDITLTCVNTVDQAFYNELLGETHHYISIKRGNTYELLSNADVAFVASGTATLETALFDVPQVVCYHTSKMNYEIGKRLVDLPFISLVNLISEQQVVPELIQDDLNTERLMIELEHLEKEGDKIKAGYFALRNKLKVDADPSDRAASIIVG